MLKFVNVFGVFWPILLSCHGWALTMVAGGGDIYIMVNNQWWYDSKDLTAMATLTTPSLRNLYLSRQIIHNNQQYAEHSQMCLFEFKDEGAEII